MSNPTDSAPRSTVTTSAFFDEAGLAYEEGFAHNAGLLRALEKLMTLVAPAGAHAHALDCGSGTGRPVSSTLAAAGFRVHGIDFSETMVELARRHVPAATFEQTDMMLWTPPLVDGEGGGGGGGGGEEGTIKEERRRMRKYGVVVASLSLFYLDREQVETMATHWHDWLEPGGCVLIVMMGADDMPRIAPELYDADGKFATKVPCVFMGKKIFVNVFSKAGWRDLLTDRGFEIVYEEVYIFTPPEGVVNDEEPHHILIAKKV